MSEEKKVETAKNEIAVKHGYADWFQIDMTEDSQCEKDEVKARLMEEVAELIYTNQQQLTSELVEALKKVLHRLESKNDFSDHEIKSEAYLTLSKHSK